MTVQNVTDLEHRPLLDLGGDSSWFWLSEGQWLHCKESYSTGATWSCPQCWALARAGRRRVGNAQDVVSLVGIPPKGSQGTGRSSFFLTLSLTAVTTTWYLFSYPTESVSAYARVRVRFFLSLLFCFFLRTAGDGSGGGGGDDGEGYGDGDGDGDGDRDRESPMRFVQLYTSPSFRNQRSKLVTPSEDWEQSHGDVSKHKFSPLVRFV